MIKGIDRGTTYTKTDNMKKFKSTVRKINDDILLDNALTIEYKGNKYIIGEEGDYSTDLMKAESENTLILILAALKDTDYCDIVTGLPIGLYSKQKDKLKRMLQNTIHDVIINGDRRRINIRKAEVFPEGAGAFFSQGIESGLIIDVGGLSIDTALFEDRKLIKYSTYSMGLMKMYSKLANMLNAQYDLSLTEWKMEKVIDKGLKIYGKSVDVDHIVKRVEVEHSQGILNRLKLEYDLKAIDTILLAGGGINIHRRLKTSLKQATTINNTQYANAIGYRKIGERLFA